MVDRGVGAALRRLRAAAILLPIVVGCAASVVDPRRSAEDHSSDSAGAARGTAYHTSCEGGSHPFEDSGPARSHPRLTDDNVAAWRAYIRVDDAEQAWTRIPWLSSLGDGIAKANADGKPLLLWVMNGHPLGCT